MSRTRHQHAGAPKYTYNNVASHCNSFFDRPPEDWSYEDFVSHIARLGTFRFDVLNHKWSKSLEAIEASHIETRDRRRKAKSLLDRMKSRSHQRRTEQKNAGDVAARSTVIHGDIVHHGDIIQGGGVKIGKVAGDFVAASKKRKTEEAEIPARPPKRRARETEGRSPEVGGTNQVVDSSPTASPTTVLSPSTASSPSPRYSPAPPFGEDPYSEFGDFPYTMEFVITYLSMPPKSKRTFSTGKILEDTIFHHVRPTPPNSKWLQGNPILRWILDLEDLEVKKWFTKEEKAELLTWGPPLPKRDPAFEYAVARFPKIPTSPEQLWDIIESRSRPADEPFDETRHCTALYSTNAASSILAMMGSYNSCHWLGPQDLHEGWFAGLWHPLIDRCLYCIPSLSVSRTDIKSSSPACHNHRFDAIIRAQLADATVYELGCIEVARAAGAVPVGKEYSDAGKLVSGLRGMLSALERGVEGDEGVMRRVQVVGIQNVGFWMTVCTMNMVGANVAMLKRGLGRCVPVRVEEFGKVVEVMRTVVRVKSILEGSVEAVREWEEKRMESWGDIL